jgi:SAM-dependent methyltransferase
VTYRAGLGHELGFQGAGEVDLVTVAQALHWFDTAKFYKECRRVLREGGVLAAYGYGTPRVEHKEAQGLLSEFYTGTLRGCWENGRSHIDDCYEKLYIDFSVAFPQSIRNDLLAIEKDYSVADFVGYLSTWSGYREHRKRHAQSADPLEEIAKQYQQMFSSDPKDKPMRVISPIFMLLGRNSPSERLP